MKVNMTPNPLDVVTIHASQGDTEAREWEFELHNNGELIDTSNVTEQLFFKSYKGGTEEILPTNGSVPTTAPFLGDIRYHQGLLSDQEFTYRQSPTEEDGLAKITDIKGQTLKWNQHVKNGVNSSYGLTCTTADGTMTISGTSTIATESSVDFRASVSDGIIPVGHKILLIGGSSDYRLRLQGTYTYESGSGLIFEAPSNAEYQIVINMNIVPNTAYNFTIHPQIFDLTQMFGVGNETSTIEEFTSLFPLYYPYNSGSLIPFNGNGIKTVRKNLLPFPYKDTRTTVANVGITVNNDGSIKLNGTVNASFFFDLGNADVNNIDVLPGTYTLSCGLGKAKIVAVKDSSYFATTDSSTGKVTFTITERCKMYFYVTASSGTVFNNETIYPQFEFGSTATSYEPYTSSTLSLPISTYFPTGMKSAGNVYDELTESKAITRIGSITLNGSEAWVKSASYQGNYYVLGLLSNVKYPNPNAVSNSLILVYNTTQLSANDLCFMFDGSAGSYNVNIKNTSMTTLDQFKAWLQANPVTIYYELKTSTETSFTTASLVTENAEIPLSNEDGVLIGKCTEELSAEPGFHDAKIKLTDSDGECYSNKIELHIERSPK